MVSLHFWRVHHCSKEWQNSFPASILDNKRANVLCRRYPFRNDYLYTFMIVQFMVAQMHLFYWGFSCCANWPNTHPQTKFPQRHGFISQFLPHNIWLEGCTSHQSRFSEGQKLFLRGRWCFRHTEIHSCDRVNVLLELWARIHIYNFQYLE